MFVAYVVIALSLFPMFDQYFTSPPVVFVIPVVAAGIRAVWTKGAIWAALATLTALAFSPGELWDESRRHSSTPEWELPAYHEGAKTIEAITSPDEVVLALWPGYVFESHRQHFPGMENQFAYRITDRLDARQRDRYHILSKAAFMDAVSNRSVRILVVGAWM